MAEDQSPVAPNRERGTATIFFVVFTVTALPWLASGQEAVATIGVLLAAVVAIAGVVIYNRVGAPPFASEIAGVLARWFSRGGHLAERGIIVTIKWTAIAALVIVGLGIAVWLLGALDKALEGTPFWAIIIIYFLAIIAFQKR